MHTISDTANSDDISSAQEKEEEEEEKQEDSDDTTTGSHDSFDIRQHAKPSSPIPSQQTRHNRSNQSPSNHEHELSDPNRLAIRSVFQTTDSSMNNDGDNLQQSWEMIQKSQEESRKRRDEINAFSAMANGSSFDVDLGDASSLLHDDDDDDDDDDVEEYEEYEKGSIGYIREKDESSFQQQENPEKDDLNSDTMSQDGKMIKEDDDGSIVTVNKVELTNIQSLDDKDRGGGNGEKSFLEMVNQGGGSVYSAQDSFEAGEEENESDHHLQSDADVMSREEDRRKAEINMFAAMANGDWDPSSTTSFQENVHGHVDTIEDEKKFRKQFGSFGGGGGGGSMVYHPNQSDKVDVGGGTFVANIGGEAIRNNENRNLNAALAMFESENAVDTSSSEIKVEPTPAKTVVLPPYPSFQTTQRKPTCDQLYSEKILVPRPLFFGTVVPKRVQDVLVKGKEPVFSKEYDHVFYADDSHEHLLSPTNHDSDSEDSFDCNNLKGAVEAFGLLSLGSQGLKQYENEPLRLKSLVSLYEPVWGDAARLRREDRIREASKQSQKRLVASQNDVMSENGSVAMSASDKRHHSYGDSFSSAEVSQESLPVSSTLDMKPPDVVSTMEEESMRESTDLSENLFLQYARGNTHGLGGTFVGARGTLVSVPETDILQNISDPKGSFETSELKKHIGLNDNLSRALESLAGLNDGSATGSSSVSFGMVEGGETAAKAMENMISTVKDGRPLSNLEMTNGKVPLYGCDDAPLPNFIDLFIPETKEDQIRSYKQYESEEIISSQTLPNIFGSIVCPSTCSGPDDNHSWFTRNRGKSSNDSDMFTGNPNAPSHHYRESIDSLPNMRHISKATIPSPLPPPPVKSVSARNTFHGTSHSKIALEMLSESSQPLEDLKSSQKETDLAGWWNIDDSLDSIRENEGYKTAEKNSRADSVAIQIPPLRAKLRTKDYSSLLSPSQDDLLRQNRSLSELHPAVDTIAQIPLLSDRQPDTRYIQIDTQVVGFPSIGEVEPLFCSVALWHVEIGNEVKCDSEKVDKTLCGRVTEYLTFDIVNDADIEDKCKAALCSCTTTNADVQEWMKQKMTRCGVFPAPSYYDMNNLHAVIIVKKVLAEDADLELYWNYEADQKRPDFSKHRTKAERVCSRLGQILTPFAFGVAPLGQVMGSETRTVPTSKAAQIPLFKLSPGEGDAPIVDHIIAMIQPREHEGDGVPSAEVVNGTAMLIMRNFGYLGLHSVVAKTSKLARERLVDFTTEVQVRLRQKSDNRLVLDDDGGRVALAKEWHGDIIAEYTSNGGRVYAPREIQDSYAQEVAQIPLYLGRQYSRLNRHLQLRKRYFTSLCNELILQPLNIENCPKRNITVKVEIVRIIFREDLGALVAVPVENCIHNPRRGPYLVGEAYSTCAYHKIDPHFVDEVKVKLPLTNLKSREYGTLAALFTAFHVSVKVRKKWPRLAGGSNDNPLPLEQIGCGYLPLGVGEGKGFLVEDDVHGLHLKYKAKALNEHKNAEQSHLPPETKVLDQMQLKLDDMKLRSPSSTDDSTELRSCDIDKFIETNTSKFYPSPKHGLDIHSQSSLSSITEKTESVSADNVALTSSKKPKDQQQKQLTHISLNVRTISLSSIHPQNQALSYFFHQAPKVPQYLSGDEFCGIWKMEPQQIKTEIDEISAAYGNEVIPSEARLLQSVVEITKNTICSQEQLTAHFIRIALQLYRSLVAGTGKPSIAFANPSLSTPLRVHSFSALLYVLNSASSFLTKSEVKSMNGNQKWSLATMSRLVAVLFDEETIFLDPNKHVLEEHNSLTTNSVEEASYSQTSDTKPESFDLMQTNFKSDLDEKASEELLASSSTTDAPPERLGIRVLDIESSHGENIDQIETPPSLSPTSSQDDIAVKGTSRKPSPLRLRSFSAPTQKQLKVDTKSDFQFALSAGLSPSNGSCISPFGGTAPALPAASRRKWLTGTLSLATISEDNDKIDIGDTLEPKVDQKIREDNTVVDIVDTELVRHSNKGTKVKQMRVPNIQKSSLNEEVTVEKKRNVADDINNISNDSDSLGDSQSSMTVPNMEEIESAGTAFLDSIDKKYGYGLRENGGEERRVGVSNHRKTKSRLCSIDWSLPPTDHVIESHQQMEILNHGVPRQASDYKNRGTSTTSTFCDVSICEKSKEVGRNPVLNENQNDDGKREEVKNVVIPLPSYLDRISSQRTNEAQGRWFPYAYEVIIFQWLAVLNEQRKKSTKTPGKDKLSPAISQSLLDAALKARGVSISCAPILFAIIKQSLGFRIDSLFRRQTKDKALYSVAPPLVTLDASLLSALELLIIMTTDACIDSRNFDSWSFRNTSIAVNDSIARFLRDIFAFLDSKIVHRLILLYFSRFVCKEGKQWQDRHSKIGLRCSWEVSKLRLNAITTFVRFLDFVNVNKPLMECWGDWTLRPPTRANRFLFSNAVDELMSLGMETFADIDANRKKTVTIPEFKPHWLVELVTDICLSATGHLESNIQNRAAALLYELFWASSVLGKLQGSSTIVASLYLPFIPKLLCHVTYLSSLHPKSQLRKDLLPCFVFVLQGAPFGLLRALWRKLFKRAEGKGRNGHYGGINHVSDFREATGKEDVDKVGFTVHDDKDFEEQAPSIFDLCSLLNLSLTTFEYEGSESNIDASSPDLISQWHTEYLLAPENEPLKQNKQIGSSFHTSYTSTSSRKWHSHDAATVIISTCRNVVREYVSMLNLSSKLKLKRKMIGPIATLSDSPICTRKGSTKKSPSKQKDEIKENIRFSYEDKVVFLRAIASVYLNCLSLRQSDTVLIKTLLASTEILKVFGIELFLTALGETLQHWMRVILFHCGARRAKVRVEALDFLALILRLQWDCFGSFTRVRIPLIATMTEVMERIVATAAARYYRSQKRQKIAIQYLSNVKAEASLTPLWRTLTRLHDGSASNNAAFKSALQLLATKMKILYKSYIAAHALAIVNRNNQSTTQNYPHVDESTFETTRVVMESAEFSKKILGYSQFSTDGRKMITHNEVVEDAFLAAANVFLATELPLHRVAWLKKLADFHATRGRYAEEAACRLQIHNTLKQAANLHESLWNSKPFWPWANDALDGVHLKGEGPVGINGYMYETEKMMEGTENMNVDGNESFRRIFYRVANSVRMRTGDWDVGGTKTLFCGVTFASEYTSVASWIALREIESDMVEEAEHAGELYLKAGIVESSRYCWGLATQFYSNMFNYARLAYCYRKLANVVASQVPTIDTSSQLELSSPLGRFYRVYFHGGAAHELMGKEFVYRAPVQVKLEEFCKNIKKVLKSILHEKTDIDLVLDDGRVQETNNKKHVRRQLGAVPRESITIKVTPLKPLLSMDKCPRGSAEWFYQQIEIADFSFPKSAESPIASANIERNSFWTKKHPLFSTISSNTASFGRPTSTHKTFQTVNANNSTIIGGEEIKVCKFSFTQPRDRLRGTRDVLKAPNGDIAEKNLRVTELQVSESMPNCVTRQPVAVENRSVFNQSPLEAGVEAVCSWCAILFRTAVATNGLAVIGDRADQGIGTAALRVISECIHRSKVKEIGLTMLVPQKSENSSQSMSVYERLSDEEVTLNQVKLARGIIIFMELLHVLIGRNRDILLNVHEIRKKRDASSTGSNSGRGILQHGMPPSPGHSLFNEGCNRTFDDFTSTHDGCGSRMTAMDRTDKAMAIQRELQLSFVKITKALHPAISLVVRSETPKWMRLCCQDNYFSSGAYNQTRIAIGEELLFFGNGPLDVGPYSCADHENFDPASASFGIPLSILPSLGSEHGSYAESETTKTHSLASSRESRSANYTV